MDPFEFEASVTEQEKQLLEETIDQIIDSLWFRYDENGDGELELDEAHTFFRDVLRESGLYANQKIEESSIREMFSDFD